MKLVASTLIGAAAAVHPQRLDQIQEILRAPGLTWTPGVNARFASQAPGASKSLNGVKEGWQESLEKAVYEGRVHEFSASEDAIPDSFDSAENWPNCADLIDDIRDQSNCGCCWAFAGAEVASDRLCISTDGAVKVPLSAQEICFCGSTDGCNGGFIQEPFDYITESGAVTGGQYKASDPLGVGTCSSFSLPHCHHHGPTGDDPYPAEGEAGCPDEASPACPAACDADASSEHGDWMADRWTYTGKTVTAKGEANIQKMIMAGGPVETAFTVYDDFEDYAGGIYQHVTGKYAGGHAVKMVGWGEEKGVKYWKVANSWNPYWGEDGYFRILRGSNECGIEDKVIGSDASAKWAHGGSGKPVLEECILVDAEDDCKARDDCGWCYMSIIDYGYCDDASAFDPDLCDPQALFVPERVARAKNLTMPIRGVVV